MTAFFTGTALGRNLVALGAALITILAGVALIFRRGRMTERASQATRQAKANAEAMERMNDAPTLSDATDPERVDWLRDYAARNRN